MRDTASRRLTETAARLFQARGLSRVGINEIIREADVARMSLYNNFHSKEALALAAYEGVSLARRERVDHILAHASEPIAAINAIFDLALELASGEGFRGCAFIDLAAHAGEADAALAGLVRAHKCALRERFTQLAAKACAPDPETLGRQWLALWDGALTDAHIEGDVAPILAAREAAARLLTQVE